MALPPCAYSRVTKHKKPRYQLYQPGFNDFNSCWLNGTWTTVTAEEFEKRAREHEDVYQKAMADSPVQNPHGPPTKPKDMSPAQKQAWEHFSGEGRVDVRNPDGSVGVCGTRLCAGRISDETIAWLRKGGYKVIPKVLQPNGKKPKVVDQTAGVPADILSDDAEPVDVWKLIVRQNKSRMREMSLAMARSGRQDICGVSMDSMALHNIVELEEGIIRHETSRTKDDLETLEEVIRDYVECRAEMEKVLGDRFQAAYESSRESHNSCARANLDSSDGFSASYVLPKFNPDGTHDPIGPRDFPWARKG